MYEPCLGPHKRFLATVEDAIRDLEKKMIKDLYLLGPQEER
jgi:hypothetical protein